VSALTLIVFELVAISVKPSTVVVDEIVPRLLKLLFLKFQDVVVDADAVKLIELAKVAKATTKANTAVKLVLRPLFKIDLIKPPIKFNAKIS
jgi:hypothetical protein